MQDLASSQVQKGEVLAGKYRIDSVLGVGGMGVVVAATHLQLQQKVALKFMLPAAMVNQQAVERFAREARAAVRLRSEHVARVIDVGTLETGSPYMVMEFLEGHDLGKIVEGGNRVGVAEAADYVLQACDAVAEAHALGIVHRDLKPRNLFLTTGRDGNPLVKVLDFGISKMSEAGDLALTRTTEVIGSPVYMSPEQLRASRDVDERTDIWSIGVILYELLTGVPPFFADTLTVLTARVLLEPARPVRELRAEVPVELEQLIERCLEKDPTKRIASVAEVAAVLDAFAPEHSKGIARRIRQMGEVQRGGSVIPPPTSSPDVRVAVSGGTSVSWGKTEADASGSVPPPPKRPTPVPSSAKSPPWAVLGVIAVAGAAVTIGVLALRSPESSVAPLASATVSAAVAPASVPSSVPTAPPASAPAAASPSASSVPAAPQATVAATPVPSASRPSTPPSSTKPAAAKTAAAVTPPPPKTEAPVKTETPPKPEVAPAPAPEVAPKVDQDGIPTNRR